MASLYNTSQNARKILLVVLIVVIGILAYDTITSFQQTQNISTGVERRFYVDPDNRFGEIPNPEIPQISVSESTNPTYSLRQPNFGAFPDVAIVYALEQPGEKLGTYEEIVTRASILGFTQSSLSEEGRQLKWSIPDNTKTLRFHRDTFQWELTTNYTTNVEAIRRKTISNQTTTYGRNGISLLRRLVLNSASYNFGFRDAQQTVTLANIGPSGLFYEVQSAAEAQYVRVDLYRQLPLANLKPQSEQPTLNTGEVRPTAISGIVYREDPRKGTFSSIVSNSFNDYSKDLFEMDYIDFNYTGDTGIYYIITPEDAWTKIQNGEASLVAMETIDTDQFTTFPVVNVRRFEADPLKTRLGYFEPREWTGYVTPIYIFEGTATLDTGRLANFTFFVNALRERAAIN